MSFAWRPRLALVLILLLAAGTASAQATLDALFRMVPANDLAGVRTLLARGLDADSVNADGDPILLVAARESSVDMVRLLLSAKANPNLRNRFGDSPIMVAAFKGNLATVKALREAGAEINHRGWTPLAYAAAGGHGAVVDYLLGSGAFMNTVAPNGTTPLMMAVRGGHLETVHLLLEHGADVDHRNEGGASALSWARERRFGEIEKLLRAAGAKD